MDNADLNSIIQRNPVLSICAGLGALTLLLDLALAGSGRSDDHIAIQPSLTSSVKEATTLKRVKVGEKAAVKTAFFGCENIDDLKRFKMLLRAHDEIAARRFTEDHECHFMQMGTRGVVKDYSLMHNAFCLRSTGNTTCAWFSADFVEPS